MSRTIAPLRSLSSIVSRRGLSRSNVVLPFGRFYSTEGTADSSSSVEELTKTIGELESSKVELEKRVTEAETKAKDAQVGLDLVFSLLPFPLSMYQVNG